MLKLALTLSVVAATLSGCAAKNGIWSKASPERMAQAEESDRPKSQLEIREMQTRNFADCDSTKVLKALLDVLQDDGFVVKNAVTELGLLSAIKEVDVSNAGEAVISSVLFGIHARWNKNSIIEATANVSPAAKDCKVRVTFQSKTLNNRGEVVGIRDIADAKYYQEFFAKVDKGIFIHREGI